MYALKCLLLPVLYVLQACDSLLVFQSDAPQEALHVGGIVFERSVTEGSLEQDVGTQRSRCSQRPSEYIEYQSYAY